MKISEYVYFARAGGGACCRRKKFESLCIGKLATVPIVFDQALRPPRRFSLFFAQDGCDLMEMAMRREIRVVQT